MFEVQHYTLCDGWINCWSEENEDGVMIPSVYRTYTEALSALNEFLEDELMEYNAGNIVSMYEMDEFRIMEITNA